MICPRCGKIFFKKDNVCPKCNLICESEDRRLWFTKKKSVNNRFELNFLQIFLIFIINTSAICLLINYFTLKNNNWWSFLVAAIGFGIYFIMKLYAANKLLRVKTFRQLSYILFILLIIIQQTMSSGMWVFNYYLPVFTAISMIAFLGFLIFSDIDMPSLFYTIWIIAVESIIPYILYKSGVTGIGEGITSYFITASFIISIVGIINASIFYMIFLKNKVIKIMK